MNYTPIVRSQALVMGLLLILATFDYYFIYGYKKSLVITWLVALIMIATYFMQSEDIKKLGMNRFGKADAYAIIFLLVIFAPLYLIRLYTIPWQINSDEVTIAQHVRSLISQNEIDLFGPSNYFNFPAFIFVFFGWLAQRLGEVTLLNMRAIHALFGLLIIVPSFLFFRLFLSRVLAVGTTALIMSNHTLIFISRMVMRNNVGLLNEMAALLILFYGLKRQSLFYTFLGGIVAGFSFYHYPPARIIFFIWIFFLATLMLFWRKTALSHIVSFGVISCLGFFLTVAPMLIAIYKIPPSPGPSYSRQQLLIFPEGRLQQQQWHSTPDPWEAVKINIKQGVTMFNRPLHDLGYMYPNYGLHSGFIDPLTGILLWIGLVNLIFKRPKDEQDILMVSSFIFLWAVFTFLVNKAPFYTRLFVILPFIAYLVIIALKKIAALISKSLKLSPQMKIVMVPFVLSIGIITIAGWNLKMGWDVVQTGFTTGNDVGGTGRFVEARIGKPSYAFYLIASQDYPYYNWGLPYQWKGWLGFFVSEHQKFSVLNPEDFISKVGDPPFTLFMNQKLWHMKSKEIKDIYENLVVHNIKPDGSLIAIEIFH